MFSEEFLKKLSIADYSYTETHLAESFDKYSDWVDLDKHAPLNYLADHRKDIRKDLRSFFPEFQSALIFLFDYAGEKKALNEFYDSDESNGLKISSYVFGFNGEDYHIEIRRRLNEISNQVKVLHPDIEVKMSLDIHPVLERDLAHRSGLGWFGKNSMLINKKEGSFVLIASLLFDQCLNLNTKPIEIDHCGTCTKCIDACPTDAIDVKSRTLISNKCISTWTIELFKEASPLPGHPEKSNGEIYGCDICQDVCPWNIKKINKVESVKLDFELAGLLFEKFLTRSPAKIMDELDKMSNSKFKKVFSGTPLARTGRIGMIKNLKPFVVLED